MTKKRIGAVCGAIIASFAMTGAAAAETKAETRTVSFFVELPADVLSVSHGGEFSLAPFPENIPLLSETPISNMLALTSRIREESGEIVGLASELEVFPPGAKLEPGVQWQTNWTIMVPGRGSLFVYEHEQVAPEHLEAFAKASSGGDWVGMIRGQPTVGPHPSGRGLVIGGTGEFEGARGTFAEIVDLLGMSADGVMKSRMELNFEISMPDASAEATAE